MKIAFVLGQTACVLGDVKMPLEMMPPKNANPLCSGLMPGMNELMKTGNFAMPPLKWT